MGRAFLQFPIELKNTLTLLFSEERVSGGLLAMPTPLLSLKLIFCLVIWPRNMACMRIMYSSFLEIVGTSCDVDALLDMHCPINIFYI
jgi:hypothetical protein